MRYLQAEAAAAVTETNTAAVSTSPIEPISIATIARNRTISVASVDTTTSMRATIVVIEDRAGVVHPELRGRGEGEHLYRG